MKAGLQLRPRRTPGWNDIGFDAAGYAARDEIAGALSLDMAAAARVMPPRLPVPDLAATCRAYLKIAEPLLAREALARTREIVADFLGRDGDGEGQRLQRSLLAVDLQAPHGYLHDLWQARYLSMRDPLPVTQNVAGGFALPDAVASLPLAHKAGLVAFTTALFLHDALSGRLPQDRQSGRPLCMLQYAMLAGTNRIPQPLTDRVQAGAGLGHCIVAWRGAFFPLPLARGDRLRDPDRLRADIRAILDWRGEAPPVGLLTGLPRDDWAALRAEISDTDHASLDAIDAAAFILCIDEGRGDRQPLSSWLFGGGNRWFDKTLQIILSDGPMVGCNIEHSALDGLTLDRLACFARGIFASGAVGIGDSHRAVSTAPLAWVLPPRVASAVRAMDEPHRDRTAGLKIRTFTVERDSPGARTNPLVQLALQVTSLRCFGRIDNIYQPVHMRHYRAGRTEAAHPVTASSVAACSAFLADAGPTVLRPLVRRALRDIGRCIAASRHRAGVDRHLFALQRMAQIRGERPAIFDDPTYALVTGPARICTSALPAGGLDLFGFAPVRRDGYGLAYVIGKSRISFSVTSWADDLGMFCSVLEGSLASLIGIVASL